MGENSNFFATTNKWLSGNLYRGDDDDCPEFECPARDGSFADPCTCRRKQLLHQNSDIGMKKGI